MKKLFTFLFLTSNLFLLSQEPNDCVNLIQICGNQDINLDVQGRGNQNEIGSNACNSGEHNSLWIRVTIEVGGTLGFTLTPQSSALSEDYDFWIFGPNSTCNNLGVAIRCSTTNPNNAGLNYNTTGLRDSENDTSEGPGSDGNSFVQSLNVSAGESYIIVLDRPIGQSAFNLSWSGSAIINNPFSNVVFPFNPFESLNLCDNNGDGLVNFDFDTLSSNFLNGNSGFSITYHDSLEDATIGFQPITGNNPVGNNTYYARVLDEELGCFEIHPIEIRVSSVVVSELNLSFCDDDEDGSFPVDLSSFNYQITPIQNYNLSFYSSQSDAASASNPISELQNLQASNNTFYVRAEGPAPDFCNGIGKLNLFLESPIMVQDVEETLCDDDFDGILTINLNDYVSDIALSTNYNNARFYNSFNDANMEQNSISNSNNHPMNNGDTVFVRIENSACFAIAEFTLNVLEIPNLGEDVTIYFCPEESPIQLSVSSQFFSYSWSHSPSETSNEVVVSEPGVYTVTASNGNCENEKSFNLQYYTFPAIQFIEELQDDNIRVNAVGVLVPLYYSIDNGNTWQLASEFNDLEAGLYEILVKYENGCVSEPFPFVVLRYSNVITPNADGINDFWEIPYLEFLEDSEVKIYDKFGKLVHQEKVTEPFRWSGKYLGRALPSTAYWFEIILKNQQSRKGWILIKNREN